MAGGGADVVPVSPGAAEQPAAKKRRAAGRRHHQAQAAACLPLDVIVEEIAARSDAATLVLVRCAATCMDARHRIAEDPNLRGRLRLRDTGRFLLPLLRGHLVGIETYVGDLYEKADVYLVDTTAADATRLVKATLVESETLRDAVPVDSRGGLVLVRASSMAPHQPHLWRWHDKLLVCNLATRRAWSSRRRLVLPSEPSLPLHLDRGMDVQFVLLVGDSDGEGGSAVGRPFQVLMTKLVLSKHNSSKRRLLVYTFSSEHGAWSPLTEIPTPNLHGSTNWPSLLRPLVIGDVVHWLCLTEVGSYVLALHARAARVNLMALPASFPHYRDRDEYLLAAASAGGNPVVLVADKDMISAWEQSKHTKMWQPQMVIETEAISAWEQWQTQALMENKAIPLAKHVPDH